MFKFLKPDVDFDAYIVVAKKGSRDPFSDEDFIGHCRISTLRRMADACNDEGQDAAARHSWDGVYACIFKFLVDHVQHNDAQRAKLGLAQIIAIQQVAALAPPREDAQ